VVFQPLDPSPAPPLHRSTAPPLHRSTAPPLHRSTAPPLHRSTAPPLHRSTASNQAPPGSKYGPPPQGPHQSLVGAPSLCDQSSGGVVEPLESGPLHSRVSLVVMSQEWMPMLTLENVPSGGVGRSENSDLGSRIGTIGPKPSLLEGHRSAQIVVHGRLRQRKPPGFDRKQAPSSPELAPGATTRGLCSQKCSSSQSHLRPQKVWERLRQMPEICPQASSK
jgi:hypothetical protein